MDISAIISFCVSLFILVTCINYSSIILSVCVCIRKWSMYPIYLNVRLINPLFQWDYDDIGIS